MRINRTFALTLVASLAIGFGFASGGCSSDEEQARPSIPASRLKSAGPARALTPDEKAVAEAHASELAAELLVWPEGQGPKRDVAADHIACREQIEQDPALARANDLLRLTAMTRCMAEKGWVLNPDPDLAGG